MVDSMIWPRSVVRRIVFPSKMERGIPTQFFETAQPPHAGPRFGITEEEEIWFFWA